MSNNKSNDFFWPSYTDLMTSLFFVMLLLYVLTYAYLNVIYKATKEQLEKIQAVEKAVSEIDSTNFDYNEEYKKHVLKMNVAFDKNSADINDIPKSQQDILKDIGESLYQLIKSFEDDNNVRYLLIIEGQASKDGWDGNWQLSYERSRALLKFWKDEKIAIDKLKNCELILAGSGEGGIPRMEPDRPPNNQRFLIHIIPKVGSMVSEERNNSPPKLKANGL